MAPRLLFLSHITPFPPDSGCTSRTLNVLRQLRREFEVQVVMYSRRNHQSDPAARAEARAALVGLGLRTVGDPVPIPAEWSRLRRLADHAGSAVSGRPYTVFQFRTPEYGRQISAALADGQPDLVHIDALDLHSWLDVLPPVPVACTHHDIESEHLMQRASAMANPLLAWHVRRQARLMKGLERSFCPRFATNVMMSPLDAGRLRQIAPGSHTTVVPNGVDTDFFAPTPPSAVIADRLVFVGPTYTYPNRDAVAFLLDEVWPRVKAKRPNATLHLVGGGSAEALQRYRAAPDVTVHGKVPDIRPHVQSGACLLSPLRYGGGTRVKILDAWAMAKPIVSTTIGCEGLDARDGENLLVRDGAEAFAEGICEALADRALASRLGDAGRTTVESTYAWDVVGEGLRAAYHEIMRTAARPVGAPVRTTAPRPQ